MNNIANIGQLFNNLNHSLAQLHREFDTLRQDLGALKTSVQPVIATIGNAADAESGMAKYQSQLDSVTTEISSLNTELKGLSATVEQGLKTGKHNLTNVEGKLSSRLAVLEIKEKEGPKTLSVDDVKGLINESITLLLGDISHQAPITLIENPLATIEEGGEPTEHSEHSEHVECEEASTEVVTPEEVQVAPVVPVKPKSTRAKGGRGGRGGRGKKTESVQSVQAAEVPEVTEVPETP